jgi:hypothetical protein
MLIDNSKRSMSLANLKKQELELEQTTAGKKVIKLEGKSLKLFSIDNGFRLFCRKIATSYIYEPFILSLIAISTLLLILDNPLNDENGTMSIVLKRIDYFMTLAFTLECLIGTVVYGLLFNGP